MMKGRRKRRWICEGVAGAAAPFCRRKSQGGGEEEEEGSRVREKGEGVDFIDEEGGRVCLVREK